MSPEGSRWYIRCLVCGGRGGWWTGDHRDRCLRCRGTGYQTVTDSTALLALSVQDHDGFTPDDVS